MTALLTGGGGQLATELVPALQRQGLAVVALGRTELDITDEGAVMTAVRRLRPAVIVNAAADADVDGCERREAAALAVNGTAVGHLADAAASVGAHLVTVSTDYVFDGSKPSPYVESDPPNPQSAYGRTKLAGERAAGGGATIVRTAWLAGAHGPNIVKTVLRLLEGDGELRFVDDQRGSPTFAADLAEAIANLAVERTEGLFHLTNSGSVSWYEFVVEIARQVGADVGRVVPISSAELEPPRPAPRPANSVLDNAAWRASGRAPLRHHREALGDLLGELGARG